MKKRLKKINKTTDVESGLERYTNGYTNTRDEC